MLSDKVIELKNVSKVYKLYHRPMDRLLQMLPWNKNKTLAEEFWALRNINMDIQKTQIKEKKLKKIMASSNSSNTQVKKRDGRLEPLDINKIHFVVE